MQRSPNRTDGNRNETCTCMTEHALKAERVLVTGAAGFIGFHLVSRLLKAGATVHGLDNLEFLLRRAA